MRCRAHPPDDCEDKPEQQDEHADSHKAASGGHLSSSSGSRGSVNMGGALILGFKRGV
jgi:hypothetical protein